MTNVRHQPLAIRERLSRRQHGAVQVRGAVLRPTGGTLDAERPCEWESWKRQLDQPVCVREQFAQHAGRSEWEVFTSPITL